MFICRWCFGGTFEDWCLRWSTLGSRGDFEIEINLFLKLFCVGVDG